MTVEALEGMAGLSTPASPEGVTSRIPPLRAIRAEGGGRVS